jgi:hypothetical protein
MTFVLRRDQEPREGDLTDAEQSAAETNAAAEVNVDRIGKSLAGHAAG